MRKLRRIRLVDDAAEADRGTPENSVRRRLMMCEAPWTGPEGTVVRVLAAGHLLGEVRRTKDGMYVAVPGTADLTLHAGVTAAAVEVVETAGKNGELAKVQEREDARRQVERDLRKVFGTHGGVRMSEAGA